jgi:DNA-binding transcriptional regulator GbsR (MarR family)
MSQDAREVERQRFVNSVGLLFARYGVTTTFGRVFALLLTSDDPLGIDDMAAWLGTSKSGTSVAARELERLGLVHRHLTPGSRRILYEASDDMVPMFEAQFARIRQQRALIQQGEQVVSASGLASQRLRTMVALHDFWLAESAAIVERWRRQ